MPFAAYGEEIRDHIEQLNRPMFVNDLAASWLPAIPELHDRLQADPPARVAEVACGAGWASIALATAYPKVRVDGFDLDAASIERAARNAAAAGVADRVSFAVGNAADPKLVGRYHAVMMFEALHDIARPVEALAAARHTDGRRRLRDRRRRAGRGGLHRPRRRRGTADVRVQHPALLAGQPHREPVRGHRHRRCARSILRAYANQAGFGQVGRLAHRERDVALLPADHRLTGDQRVPHTQYRTGVQRTAQSKKLDLTIFHRRKRGMP